MESEKIINSITCSRVSKKRIVGTQQIFQALKYGINFVGYSLDVFKVPHIFCENRRKAKINDKRIQLIKLVKRTTEWKTKRKIIKIARVSKMRNENGGSSKAKVIS